MSGNVNTWVSYNNSPYQYYVEASQEKTEDYEVARSECSSLGGMLASVKSAATQQFLETLIPSEPNANQTRSYWIGAHRTSQNSTWIWEDNTALNYTNWKEGEDTSSQEFCAAIFPTFQFEWFTSNCVTEYFGYVCQRDAADSTAAVTMVTTSATTATATTAGTSANIIEETTKVTTLNYETTDDDALSNLLLPHADEFPYVQVIVPIVIGLILISGLIFGLVLIYKRKYHKETTWAPMTTTGTLPRSDEERNIDHRSNPTDLVIEHPVEDQPNSEPVVTFKNREQSQFTNPTYDRYESPSTQRQTGQQKEDEYVDVYSTSRKTHKKNII